MTVKMTQLGMSKGDAQQIARLLTLYDFAEGCILEDVLSKKYSVRVTFLGGKSLLFLSLENAVRVLPYLSVLYESLKVYYKNSLKE